MDPIYRFFFRRGHSPFRIFVFFFSSFFRFAIHQMGDSYDPSGFAGHEEQVHGEHDSPTTTQKNWRDAPQTIHPCTIRQILQATYQNESFHIDGQEVLKVLVVGQVQYVQKNPTFTTFELSDGTGMITARAWEDEERPKQWPWQRFVFANFFPPFHSKFTFFCSEEGYIRVFANLKHVNEQKSLVVLNAFAMEDLNELTHHFAEVIATHLFFTRGPSKMVCDQQNPHGRQQNGFSHQTGLPDLVRQVIDVNSTPSGPDFAEIVRNLRAHGANESEEAISQAIQELLIGGLIFTTIDDYHWKTC